MLSNDLITIVCELNPQDYGIEYNKSLIIGVIALRITENNNGDFLKFTYYLFTTYMGYIATLGIVEPLRGLGIAK